MQQYWITQSSVHTVSNKSKSAVFDFLYSCEFIAQTSALWKHKVRVCCFLNWDWELLALLLPTLIFCHEGFVLLLMNGLQLYFQVCVILALKTTNLMPEHTPERSQQLPSHNPSIEERDHTYHLGPHHDVCLWLEKEHHFTLNHEELTSRLTTINSCWSKACGKDKQWRQLGSQNSAWSRFSKASPRTWLTRETRASEISSSVMMTQHNSMEFHHWVGRRYLTWVYAGV